MRSAALLFAAALTVCAGVQADAFVTGSMLDPLSGTRALDRASFSDGPLAPDAPDQVNLEEDLIVQWEGYRIEALQGFGIEALVLSRKDYHEGDMGVLVPLDLALAWGKMSDPSWVRHLQVSQSERLYRWSFPPGTELDQRMVETSSANMHIMPASESVRDALRGVARGDVVRLTGFLVNITGPDDFSWNTSVVRTDVGLGACELILVTGVEIAGR